MKEKICLVYLLIFSGIFALENEMEYHYLDNLALAAGADKGSSYHNYTEIYAEYFAHLKDQPVKFLEIGIHQGTSVKLWESYFTKADLHFIDITFDTILYHSQRSHYHLVNQESVIDLQKFIQKTGGNFDIILDDGGHMMNQQITSFVTLFPHVKSGGIYIIEDMHTSYWRIFGGGNHPRTAINFFKKLIDDVNYIGNHTAKASHLNIPPDLLQQMNEYQKNIKSISFFDSVVVVRKR